MGDSIAVSVQNVSKKFRLFGSPKDRLREALHPFKRKYHREFWALKDISFEVPRGMTFGIVGRNGSGKSTLLQIICSVLKPTLGMVAVNGRVSALLELGTGFNPEFTGRENVLLNGALMGFSRREMEERLPVIEAFADIGEFIDQPVKIYSSGMFVRLAFAAAINVDPDILIVDEALAVGDAKFQHKCYQKFLEFQEAGKTILFVTHNTDAVIKHCDCAILFERGEVVEIGEPKHIINYYIDLLFTGKISNYQFSPVLVEEGYRGFNIVHYKTKYYAVLQSLGSIDFTRVEDNYLKTLTEEKRCAVGISFEEAKQLVIQINPNNNASLSHNADTVSAQLKTTELYKFLKEIPTTDSCIHRKSYNKNEYRQGYRKAEIVDYLIVCGDKYDPTNILSGDMVDIYIKAKFHKNVEFPLFGFSIKTVDGILIYALNTFFTKVFIPSIKESDTIVSKFSLKMNLNRGDFFIDLGLDESSNTTQHQWLGRQCAYESLDRRCAIIHLFVQEKNWFHGYVDLEAEFQEIVRNGKSVDKYCSNTILNAGL